MCHISCQPWFLLKDTKIKMSTINAVMTLFIVLLFIWNKWVKFFLVFSLAVTQWCHVNIMTASAACSALRSWVSSGSRMESAQKGVLIKTKTQMRVMPNSILWDASKWLQISLVSVDALSGPGRKWSERPEHVGAKWVKCCWFVSSWHLNPRLHLLLRWGRRRLNAEGRRTTHTHTRAAAAWRKITYIHHDARGRAQWLLPTTARARMLG